MNDNDHPGNELPSKVSGFQKAIDLALGLDPISLKSYVDQKRQAYPSLSARELAELIVRKYASKAGMEGFLSGLPSNVLVAFPVGVADMTYVLRCYASLSAMIGFLSNPDYFSDPDWRSDAYVMVSGPSVVSRVFRDAGIAFSKEASKQLIRKYLSKGVLKGMQRFLLKWFGTKVLQRTIIIKTLPVVGGIVGGTWNYAEIRFVGGRAIAYHFDDRLK